MMHQKLCTRSWLLAGGFAVAVAAGACSRDNIANNRAPGAGADTNQPAANTTVTGCLQKGSGGGDYILTEAVVPTPVGTSGSADTNIAARDQQKAAAHSYRLNGDRDSNDRMDDMVGKQVRVNGRVTDQGKVTGTSGSSGEIDSKDLAVMDVALIETIADACNNAPSHEQQDKGAKAKSKR